MSAGYSSNVALGCISQNGPVSRYDRQILLSCGGYEHPVDGIAVHRARKMGRSHKDAGSDAFHRNGRRLDELFEPSLGSPDGGQPAF
ncbi:hypothetical protein MPLA_140278 [Mesorhizobium sp. ORS 3359]|nr:hypothetical protein MPLA_140278 [Mesorhizobium sp. ORS 3359]